MKITKGNITNELNDFQEANIYNKSSHQSPNGIHVLCTPKEQHGTKRSRSDNNNLDPKPKLIKDRRLKMKSINEQCKGNGSDANEAKFTEAICILSDNMEDERNAIVNGTESTEITKTDIHVNTETSIDNIEKNERLHVSSQRDVASSSPLVQKADERLRVSLRKKNDIRSSYKCDHCFKEFNTELSLKRHYPIHTSERTYKCDDCGKAFTRPYVLKNHKISIHSMEFNYKCEVCHKPYKHPMALKLHVMRTHNNLRYKCDTCGREFSALHSLKRHIMYGHHDLFGDSPVSDTECTTCGKVLSSLESLRFHMQIHEGNQGHACDLCGALFSRKTDKDRHRMTHTGEKPYKCDLCDYACIQPGEFNRHKLKHSDQSAGQGRYTCPFCDKTLVRKNEMAGHIGKHIDDVKSDDKESHIACTLCNLVLKSRSELIFHVKRFHDKQGFMKNMFECQICNTCQGSKYMLEKHMFKEHNEAILSYSCGICDLKFQNLSNLNKHKKFVHSTGMFPCPICGKVFKHESYTKEHVRRVHETTKKRYECSSCGLKFSERRYLRKHENKHQLNMLNIE